MQVRHDMLGMIFIEGVWLDCRVMPPDTPETIIVKNNFQIKKIRTTYLEPTYKIQEWHVNNFQTVAIAKHCTKIILHNERNYI